MRGQRSVPLLLVSACWVGALVYLAVAFVAASDTARKSPTSGEYPYEFLGMPLLVSFRNGDRIGLHFHWGALVLLIAPLLVGLVLMVLQWRRVWARQFAGGDRR
jgi:hypothetical protein